MIEEILFFIGRIVWGPHMLVLLIGTGLYLSVRLNFVQVRKFGTVARFIWKGARRKDGSEKSRGDISPFQALTTSLAASAGNGSIAGVATAIYLGGPGAVFWMWVSALVGMATKYSEVLLGVRYRKTEQNGMMLGGPMLYLRNAFPKKTLGKYLAGFFAFAMGIKCLFSVSMIQSNSISLAFKANFGMPMWLTGALLAFFTWIIIIGGIKSIARFTEVFAPIMSLVYFTAGIFIALLHFQELPMVFGRIFSEAFTGTAASGGFAGSSVMLAVRFGIARGNYSNEAGLGSAAVIHAAARTEQPVRQALIAMTDVFINTCVFCTISAMAVLITGVWMTGVDSTEMTSNAFSITLPYVGGLIVALSSFFFGYSSLISWPYFGEQSFAYLFGIWVKKYFRWLFCFIIFVGSIVNVRTVWNIADICNGLMAIPNLIGLLALSGVIVSLTKQYSKNV